MLEDYLRKQLSEVQKTAGDRRVLLALSGGVDSAVCASLLAKAIPGQLVCVFVDHGFMRKNEGDCLEEIFKDINLAFIRINAERRFLDLLSGITEPEEKRKQIGMEFARVFEEEAAKLGDIPFFAQGTIAADIIESGCKNTELIKSHHNVGGLPEKLNFTAIIEPLKGLYKEDVRKLGRMLGLPAALTERQPFPGPGLSIRVLGEVTREKLEIVREADAIFCEEIEGSGIACSQYFALLPGIKSVGIKNGKRAYEYVIALRAVTTNDYMTCGYVPLPHKLLARCAERITGEVSGAGRVVYDITNKPPGTLEWE